MENIILQMADGFYKGMANMNYEEQKALLSILQTLIEVNHQ